MRGKPEKPPGFETLCVHKGGAQGDVFRSLNIPIYTTSTFTLKSSGEQGEYVYTRMGNPTRTALEQTLAALEGGARATATASGMAAETTVMHLFDRGTRVVAGHDIYGGTYKLFTDAMTRLGMTFTFVDMRDVANVKRAITRDTKVVWMESPSNPLVNLVDIRAVCRLARARGITTVVDSTFASPCFQRPLDLGADVVVHSTTKYLNGHSDVVGGAVISKSAETGRRIADLASELGTPCSPFDAWLVLRGLRTLPIRMQAHQRNATALAKFLEKRRDVRRVHYPGLRSHPQHALAKRQMSGFGGMLSFEIRGGRREVFRLFGKLRLFASAASLGGVESLIEHPATLSHAPLTPEARAAAGISDGLIRVSAGIEDPDDLVRDMEQALDAL